MIAAGRVLSPPPSSRSTSPALWIGPAVKAALVGPLEIAAGYVTEDLLRASCRSLSAVLDRTESAAVETVWTRESSAVKAIWDCLAWFETGGRRVHAESPPLHTKFMALELFGEWPQLGQRSGTFRLLSNAALVPPRRCREQTGRTR